MFKYVVLAACVLLASRAAAGSAVPEKESANSIAEAAPVELGEGVRRITDVNGIAVKCPVHEEFIDCPQAHTCQTTCATLNQACVITPVCTAGCFCRKGFARDSTGRCVPISECPGTTCPRHERFVVCDDDWKCEKTCAGRNAECPSTAYCRGGCECQPGYYRDVGGACVRSHSCVTPAANPACARNQIWRPCAFDCLDDCRVTDQCRASVPTQTCTSGCFCEDGHGRQGDRCVLREKCLLK